MENFESEVLQRLTTIETKLEEVSKSTSTTYKNENELILLKQKVYDLEAKNKTITGAVITITVGLITALLRYLMGV